MIDVGQGDAVLVQFPSGHACSSTRRHAGRIRHRRARRRRRRSGRGVRRLDWLLFTHADRDHIGGAARVAATLAPREIWEGVPVPRSPERARAVRGTQRRGAVRGAVVHAGDGSSSAARSSRCCIRRRPTGSASASAMTTRSSCVCATAPVEFLLTGDVGSEFEAHLAAARRRTRRFGCSRSRTTAAGRRRRAASCAPMRRSSRWSAPAAATCSAIRRRRSCSRLARAGTQVFRTDRDGAISVETDGAVVCVRDVGAGASWRRCDASTLTARSFGGLTCCQACFHLVERRAVHARGPSPRRSASTRVESRVNLSLAARSAASGSMSELAREIGEREQQVAEFLGGARRDSRRAPRAARALPRRSCRRRRRPSASRSRPRRRACRSRARAAATAATRGTPASTRRRLARAASVRAP